MKIYEFQPTMIHSKTIGVPRDIFSLGLVEFRRSLRSNHSAQINEELDITIYDEDFGREMQAVFERDLERSKQYTLEDFETRSLWDRFTEWLMLPFHSQV